ncbi:DMT family transporter [Oryzifoliimicrobium ureilyticus]|uniref:DMT family transporter n=1 Tax=Oryzifoliimicrobium ureilyticus TaxID=3113724 RepID=UPI003075EF81
MNSRSRGVMEMSAAMMISGTIGLFVMLSNQPIPTIVFARCLIGALTLLVVCAVMGLFHRHAMGWRQIGLASIGGAALVVNWLLLFAAYPHISISVATAVYNTQPFMLTLMGGLLFKERLTASKFGWLALAFIGVLAIVEANPPTGSLPGEYARGIVLALGAAFFYAVAAIITKKLAGTPPHLIALIQLTIGTFMMMPFASLGSWPTEPAGWAVLASIGIVHTGLMYILLYGAIQKLPTALTGALSFIYPVVALLVDAGALGTRLALVQLAGIGLVLIAAAGSTFGWSIPIRRRRLKQHGRYC